MAAIPKNIDDVLFVIPIALSTFSAELDVESISISHEGLSYMSVIFSLKNLRDPIKKK